MSTAITSAPHADAASALTAPAPTSPTISFYAVRKGHQVGIFTSWSECKQSVHGYAGAQFKRFVIQSEAEQYLTTQPPSTLSQCSPKLPPSFNPHPRLTKWLEDHAVNGDTRSFFMRQVNKNAVHKACVKVASMMHTEITTLLESFDAATDDALIWRSGCLYSGLHRLITLASPFPGWIKKPDTIDHMEDYAHYDLDNVLKAYHGDSPSALRSLDQIRAMLNEDWDDGMIAVNA